NQGKTFNLNLGLFRISNFEIEKYYLIGVILILSPFASFYLGYQHAYHILHNERYLFTTIKIMGNEKIFKLIGFINSRYFLTDTENKNLLIISGDRQMYFTKFVKSNLTIKKS
ncbi:MAG: hypothetical protein JO149_07325, partial [Gammaproteobacteria bacterium]|nr:hypothetical protein [Gammaproteobacteria bacterium]